MKKIIFIALFTFCFISCNQNTINSYNETIVQAHEKISISYEKVILQTQKSIGKPTELQNIEKLIDNQTAQMQPVKKTVEQLFKLEKDDYRKQALQLIDVYENTLFKIKIKSKMITSKDSTTQAMGFLQNEISKFLDADTELRTYQQEFAIDNQTQIR